MTIVPIGKQNLHLSPRQGEAQTIPMRSKRYFTVEAAWYFNTREDIVQGPFKNLGAAKEGLKTYLRRCGIIHFNG